MRLGSECILLSTMESTRWESSACTAASLTGAVSPCSITARTGEMQNFDAGASFSPPPPGAGPSGRAASITANFQEPMNVSGRAYQDA